MIKITFVVLFILFILAIYCYAEFNRREMKNFKAGFLRRIDKLPEEALQRKIKLHRIDFSLAEIKDKPFLLDCLTWDDIENLDMGKLFQLRDNSPDKIFLRGIYDLPEEALQRKVRLYNATYSLEIIKKEWRTLFKLFNLEDWIRIWNNPGLVRVRANPR